MRKVVRQLSAPWLPCFSHSLHNAAQYAIGWTSSSADEAEQDDADLVVVVRLSNTKNPSAKVVFAKVQKLSGHFHHSERSVDILRRVVVLHPCSVRGIILT